MYTQAKPVALVAVSHRAGGLGVLFNVSRLHGSITLDSAFPSEQASVIVVIYIVNFNNYGTFHYCAIILSKLLAVINKVFL